LFVVCSKTPKHKQRQGVHTTRAEAEATEARAGTFASSALMESAPEVERTCCESVRLGAGADGSAPAWVSATGARAREASTLLPRIARFL